MKLKKIGLLPRIIIAIALGLLLGMVFPAGLVRIFVTFNSLFASFLFFCIPLIIVGLVAPGIADLGKSAGRLLAITALIAYGATIFAGFFAYITCKTALPFLVKTDAAMASVENPANSLLTTYFTIEIPPVFGVMTALTLAFILGIGISVSKGETLKLALTEFKTIVERVISAVIIPLLPIYIFGIFLNMSNTGTAFFIMAIFGKVILVVILLHFMTLLIHYCIAGLITKRNPFRMLYTMLPAYMTALGTASSAATIPVTLRQAKKLNIREDVVDYYIPLGATIYLAGSTITITAMALTICLLFNFPVDVATFSGFIMMLGVIMVAAPGVPGGAIMAATGVLQSMLGFDAAAIGLIIALYVAIDSLGTACNVTGDGAIVAIIEKIADKEKAVG